MRLIIVRHGESEWNRINRYQGQQDAPLSELGRKQAAALGERLKHEKIDVVYSSRLQRAAHTAQAIVAHHPGLEIIYDDALLEINHGEWPGGESFSNVLKRVLDFRERICKIHANQTVLISTHDVIVKILVADALGMNMDRINRIWVTNASISVIEYGDDLPYLVSLSEACHLGHLATTREQQHAL
jgi:probable phosphoglycerate mutase